MLATQSLRRKHGLAYVTCPAAARQRASAIAPPDRAGNGNEMDRRDAGPQRSIPAALKAGLQNGDRKRALRSGPPMDGERASASPTAPDGRGVASSPPPGGSVPPQAQAPKPASRRERRGRGAGSGGRRERCAAPLLRTRHGGPGRRRGSPPRTRPPVRPKARSGPWQPPSMQLHRKGRGQASSPRVPSVWTWRALRKKRNGVRIGCRWIGRRDYP